MLTTNYKLFSIVGVEDEYDYDGPDNCNGVITKIHDYGKDLVTIFETIELTITESRNLKYFIAISEKQREILLNNMEVLIGIYLRIRQEDESFAKTFHTRYHEITTRFELEDTKKERKVCSYILATIFRVFYAIEHGATLQYRGKKSLEEINIMMNSYLKYPGKEDTIKHALVLFSETEDPSFPFTCEEDITFPLEIDEEIVDPNNLVLPSTVKYEVRLEEDGLFYAYTSEETALEFTKYSKVLVKLACDNYFSISRKKYSNKNLHSVFISDLFDKSECSYLYITVVRIVVLAKRIVYLSKTPDVCVVTGRHLEEIHQMAQVCLEVGLFKLVSKESPGDEIKDSAELTKIIDTHFKTLDPPTGSKTKPAVRELCD